MIYVITHKKFKAVTMDGFYEILLVGADMNKVAEYKVRDNTGENISLKNAYFCELTGIYWLWKNIKDNIVGICHYRRYFAESWFWGKRSILTQERIQEYLSDSDIIMPRKRWFDGKNAKDFYAKHHNIDDWNKMVHIIHKLYPEYDNDVAWFEKQKSGYCYNMFITDGSNFNRYCEWLFSILFELEKETFEKDYSIYNRRIYGFLSERMINVWVHHNKLKVKEAFVYNPMLFSMLADQTRRYIVRKIKGEKK